MTNAAELVRKVISKDVAMRRDLVRGLLNTRALARFIQARTMNDGEELSLDAIISAVRRLPKQEMMMTDNNAGKFIQKITFRDRIAVIGMINEPEVQAALGRFASEINYTKGDIFRIVTGVESIRVIVDQKNLDKVLAKIPAKRIENTKKDLAEIIISYSEEAQRIPGMVASVTTELALNGISMYEFLSCGAEQVIVVEQSDALTSYECIERLTKDFVPSG